MSEGNDMNTIKSTITILVLILAGFLCFGTIVSANDQTYRNDAEETVLNAIQIFHKDSNKSLTEILPTSILEHATALAVFPSTTSFTVFDYASSMGNSTIEAGASWGRGVLLTRGEGGQWEAPLFVTLSGPNLTTWNGEESINLIFVFNDTDVLNPLADGKKLKLKNIMTAEDDVAERGFSKNVEFIAYQGNSGRFTEASLKRVALNLSEDHTVAYYDLPSENKGVRGYLGNDREFYGNFLKGKNERKFMPSSAEKLINAVDHYAEMNR